MTIPSRQLTVGLTSSIIIVLAILILGRLQKSSSGLDSYSDVEAVCILGDHVNAAATTPAEWISHPIGQSSELHIDDMMYSHLGLSRLKLKNIRYFIFMRSVFGVVKVSPSIDLFIVISPLDQNRIVDHEQRLTTEALRGWSIKHVYFVQSPHFFSCQLP